MSVAPVCIETELLSLPSRSFTELSATVLGVYAEQGGEAVEVALSVLVVDVTVLAADDHGDSLVLVGAHSGEVHSQVALCELLQGAALGRHLHVVFEFGRHSLFLVWPVCQVQC